MPDIGKVTVKCAHCGTVFDSPLFFDATETFDSGDVSGVQVQCPACGKMVHGNKENMRYVRADEKGGFLGNDYFGNKVEDEPPRNQGNAMKHTGETFTGEVFIDGNRYESCTFNAATLVYSGGEGPSFVDCTFRDFKFTFTGAAENTLKFLTAMYQGGFQSLIENTLQNIKTGPRSS